MTCVYFISGHLDLTPEEFREHYVPQIDQVMQDPTSRFVVGDARGADDLAQQFLSNGLSTATGAVRLDEQYRRVTVYHMLHCPRNFRNATFQRVGGFETDAERDAAMTEASDGDIAWVRPGKKARKSGTQKNLDRRKERVLARRLQERATWEKANIEELGDDGHPYLSPWASGAAQLTPIPPGFRERYEKAAHEWARVRTELRQIIAEAEALGDQTTPAR